MVLTACTSGVPDTVTSSEVASGQPGRGKPAVTIGTKNFTEQIVLGQLYAQALRARGFTVDLKPNIGSTEVVDRALTSGLIDMYPEYTGVIVTVVQALDTLTAPGAPSRPTKPPARPLEAYDQAKQFQAKRRFAMLNPTPFQSTDVILTTPDFASRHQLKTVGDLKKLKSFTNAGPPENATRYEGVIGLKQAYGLDNMVFTPMTIGTQYAALDSGQVDTIAGFTTDPQLTAGDYVLTTCPWRTRRTSSASKTSRPAPPRSSLRSCARRAPGSRRRSAGSAPRVARSCCRSARRRSGSGSGSVRASWWEPRYVLPDSSSPTSGLRRPRGSR